MKTSLFALLALTVAGTAVAAPPTDAELAACIGAKGPALQVFSTLKRGMTIAEASALYPGADKLDKYNFATVEAKACAGATKFELTFQKDSKTQELRLYGVAIIFDKALSADDDFYQRLSTLLVAKYGPVKDGKAVEKRILTWGTSLGVVQLSTLGKTYPFKLRAGLEKK
jgi:hypothetical protein